MTAEVYLKHKNGSWIAAALGILGHGHDALEALRNLVLELRAVYTGSRVHADEQHQRIHITL